MRWWIDRGASEGTRVRDGVVPDGARALLSKAAVVASSPDVAAPPKPAPSAAAPPPSASPTSAPVAIAAPHVGPRLVFRDVVAPLLAARCASCHGAAKQKGKLRVDSIEALLAGGKSGAAVVPGNASSGIPAGALAPAARRREAHASRERAAARRGADRADRVVDRERRERDADDRSDARALRRPRRCARRRDEEHSVSHSDRIDQRARRASACAAGRRARPRHRPCPRLRRAGRPDPASPLRRVSPRRPRLRRPPRRRLRQDGRRARHRAGQARPERAREAHAPADEPRRSHASRGQAPGHRRGDRGHPYLDRERREPRSNHRRPRPPAGAARRRRERKPAPRRAPPQRLRHPPTPNRRRRSRPQPSRLRKARVARHAPLAALASARRPPSRSPSPGCWRSPIPRDGPGDRGADTRPHIASPPHCEPVNQPQRVP